MTIGIIYPPPDIRAIIQRTVKYVSDNGSEFEKKVIGSKEAKNARFSFLRSSNPYHAFYQQKLTEYVSRSQDGAQASHLEPDDCEAGDANSPKPLEAPEPEKYTVRLLEGITSEELRVIKLTAQFVARNGESFFNGLQSKENNNPLFHFMKPTDRMFSFFNGLINVYSDVLRPPKDLTEKLRKSVVDFSTVLDRCLNRLEWDRSQEQRRKKDEDEKELERVEMAMIDWDDAEVVESTDFYEEEDEWLPPPTTYEEVTTKSNCRNVNDEEAAAPMRVVKNWTRPEDRIPTERDLSKVVISPITGDLIPINEMSEHMRVLLIDPKFKEQKNRMFAKIRDTTLAHDDEIAKNIVRLARLRPDIFGTTEEEVSNAVKAEIEKTKDEQPKQVIWDGRIANQSLTQNSNGQELGDGVYGDGVPTVRPFPPNLAFALNLPCSHPSVQYPGAPRTLGVPVMQPLQQQQQLLMNRPPQMQPGVPVQLPWESQFAHLQVPTPYGQLPPPSIGMVQPQAQPPLPEEPEPKRQKLDESVLIPEDQFLAQHPGSATIRVSVPNVDDGKFIEITLQSLSENVATLRTR